MTSANTLKPYSRAIVSLLKGVVDHNESTWNDIKNYRHDIQDYVSTIGLELIVKEEDGFAFLKQSTFDDDKTLNLVSRRALTFNSSVVLLVLRELQEQFDNSPTETHATSKFVNHSEILEEVEMLLPESYNRQNIRVNIDNAIKRVVEDGFLVTVPNKDSNDSRYRIHKIIKERITIDELNNFLNELNDNATDNKPI